MSRSKFVKTYPMQFMEMLEAIHNDPSQKFEVASVDTKAAKNFMMSIYAFRSAGEKEGLHKIYPELSALYAKLWKDADGNILGVEIMHRDYSPEALAVGAALAKAKLK